MVLLDAAPLVAALGGEPGMPAVRKLLKGGDAAITTLNLGEALNTLARRYGLGLERTRPAVETLLAHSLTTIPVTTAHAWRAVALRVAHYHRRDCPVSLADCVLLAAAGPGDRVATSDRAIIAVARREGIDVVPLPDSHGHFP
jgi:predicted nucleic acid-binding protein